MKRPREPDLRLLCERCGYHLKGLKRSDVCPECGKPVVESLPEKRAGSAWQQRPGWKAWWKTERRLERAPRAFWSTLAMGRKRDAVLLVINCALAAYVPILATDALPNIGSRISHRNGWGPVVGMILSTACFCLLLVLTAIEGVGLTIITKRRGWRVPRGGRLALLAHASYGWVLLAALGIGAILVLQSAAGHGTLVLALLVIPALVPLLVFETLVYIGMHRMKYANPPGSERELAGEGDSPAV